MQIRDYVPPDSPLGAGAESVSVGLRSGPGLEVGTVLSPRPAALTSPAARTGSREKLIVSALKIKVTLRETLSCN